MWTGTYFLGTAEIFFGSFSSRFGGGDFLALLHSHFLIDFAEAEFMRFLGFLGIILRVLRLEVSVWILKP